METKRHRSVSTEGVGPLSVFRNIASPGHTIFEYTQENDHSHFDSLSSASSPSACPPPTTMFASMGAVPILANIVTKSYSVFTLGIIPVQGLRNSCYQRGVVGTRRDDITGGEWLMVKKNKWAKTKVMWHYDKELW